MSPADYVVLSLLAVALAAVVCWMRRIKKKGGGCSGCGNCSHSASCRKKEETSREK